MYSSRRMHTSIVPTFVFCAVFLYWYRPSLASLPFLRSTQSSTKRIITGSSEAMGLFRVRLDMTCSWRSWRAACDCWTPMSSWARLLGILLARWVGRGFKASEKGRRTECSRACCAAAAPCWVVGGRESDGVSAVGFAGSRGALRKWWVVGGGRSGVAMRLLLAIFAVVVGLHYISEQ